MLKTRTPFRVELSFLDEQIKTVAEKLRKESKDVTKEIEKSCLPVVKQEEKYLNHFENTSGSIFWDVASFGITKLPMFNKSQKYETYLNPVYPKNAINKRVTNFSYDVISRHGVSDYFIWLTTEKYTEGTGMVNCEINFSMNVIGEAFIKYIIRYDVTYNIIEEKEKIRFTYKNIDNFMSEAKNNVIKLIDQKSIYFIWKRILDETK